MDVAGWLRGLGLGQYEANFRDNKIDADMLPRLAGDDLKDIGVSAFGDRLRLLDAIAALVIAKPSADVAASSSRSATPKVSQVSAERRPITVMFCDLVGSTTLAAKLDAEDGCGANVVGRAIRGLEVGTGHAASTAFQISEAVLFLTRSLPSLN